MPLDEFEWLRECLVSPLPWPGELPELRIRIIRRLASACQQRRSSPADRAALLRHVLRRESEITGHQQRLGIVADGAWPAAAELSQFGLVAEDRGGGNLRLSASPWCPAWLGCKPGDTSPEAAAFANALRRRDEICSGDPFLNQFGLQTYLSPGQRTAVRSVLTAPPGSSTLVVLPTGSGKSLCAQALHKVRLAQGRADGVTIVVVPTVSLALDQARTVSQMLGHPCDYVGGSSDDVRQQNADIRHRVRAGTQGMVFTAPESLLGSLRPAVYEAATNGYLKALVIDEVHLVDQWGVEFRPSFQMLAGLRRKLLETSPPPAPVTVLLSATITQSSYDTIAGLFSGPGALEVVPAVTLRPEPEVWTYECSCDEEKQQRLEEAIRHVPRPAIVYTTEVRRANALSQRLRAIGFSRLGLLTGESGQQQRDAVIKAWAAGTTDLVVGTAAFGLGIDQRDVRTVIHACVPETADRYYQEVGRCGRDGCASLSLVLYTSEDRRVGRSLARKKIITTKRGLERWQAMFHAKTVLDHPDHIRVSLDTPPGVGAHDIDLVGERSEAWNARTLTLMARAGLIDMYDTAPNATGGAGDSHSAAPSDDATSAHCTVRIINPNHLDYLTWDRLVEPARQASTEAQSQQCRLMRMVLQGRQCVGEIMKEAYAFSVRPPDAPAWQVPVSSSCGGCACCRRLGSGPKIGYSRPSEMPWGVIPTLNSELRSLLRDHQVLCVFGDVFGSGLERGERLEALVRRLGQMGFCAVSGAPDALALLRKAGSLSGEPVFLIDSGTPYPPEDPPRVPKLHVFAGTDPVIVPEWLIQQMRRVGSDDPPWLILYPSDVEFADRPGEQLLQWLPCPCVSLNQVAVRLGI